MIYQPAIQANKKTKVCANMIPPEQAQKHTAISNQCPINEMQPEVFCKEERLRCYIFTIRKPYLMVLLMHVNRSSHSSYTHNAALVYSHWGLYRSTTKLRMQCLGGTVSNPAVMHSCSLRHPNIIGMPLASPPNGRHY